MGSFKRSITFIRNYLATLTSNTTKQYNEKKGRLVA